MWGSLRLAPNVRANKNVLLKHQQAVNCCIQGSCHSFLLCCTLVVKEVLLPEKISSKQHQTQLSELQPSKHMRSVQETAVKNQEPEELLPTPIDTQPVSDDEWDPPAKFASIFTKIAKQLNKSADVEDLKCFLEVFSHPRTGQRHISIELYAHCETPREIIKALVPRYINFMHTPILRGIVKTFGDEQSKSLLKQYEDNFPRNKPLKRMRDPLTFEESEDCPGSKRMNVACTGDTSIDTTTIADVERVREAINRNTGIDESMIVYANQTPGSVVFTYLIPETVVSALSDLDEDRQRDLADHGIIRIEVNGLVIDLQSLQSEIKTDTLQPVTIRDTLQAEAKTDALLTETKTDTFHAETKTDISTYTSSGMKRVPLTHDSLKATHCNSKFQELLSEVGTSLAESVEASKLTDTTQAEPKTDTTQAEPKTDTTQAETKTDTTQAETKTDTTQAEPKTDTSQAEPTTDTSQAETKTDTSQAETKTDTTQAETKTDTTQAETKTDTTQAEAKTDTTQAEPKTDTTQAEPKTDTTQAEAKTDTMQAETKTDTTQAEAKTDTTQAEAKTDTMQAETKTDTTQAEAKTDTTQAETKTDTTQAEAKTDTTQAEAKTDTTQAEAKTDTTQAEPKTDTTQAEPKTDATQAETKTDATQAETKTDTTQAETKTDTTQAETKTDTTQAETKTDTTQAEPKTDTTQAETKTDTTQTETKTDTTQAETKTDTTQAETKTDTTQAETKTVTTQAETKTDTTQAETKTDTTQAETKTDTTQAETKTDTTQAETKTDTTQAEAKTDALQAETKTDAFHAETKTDISTYTSSGMKRVPLTHDSLKATHCNSKFQELLSEVGTSLAESVEASKLKDFLQSFSHILYPESQYIDPTLLKDTESIPQMFTALQPQVLNIINWGVLWKAIDAFDIKLMPAFQSYTDGFPPHTKLSTLPDPLSEEEILGFQKLRVTRGGGSGSGIDWTLGDVQAVREAVEKATGIDGDFIIYAYWERGFSTHQFTFLIPKSISGIFGELCEEDLAILAGIGVQRLEVDYDTVADNIQELFKELPLAAIREDNRTRTKNFGLEHFIPEDEMEQMSKEEFIHLNTLITSTPVGKLQETCSNDFLKVFAKKMGSWKDLAPYLGINQWDLEDLAERYPQDEEEQKYVALITWKSIDVNSATYERLVECLLTHGHVDDAKELLLYFQGQYTHLCDHLYFN